MPSTFVRIGNKLNQQKDTRQATFLFRRGLKVIQILEEQGNCTTGSKLTCNTDINESTSVIRSKQKLQVDWEMATGSSREVHLFSLVTVIH